MKPSWDDAPEWAQWLGQDRHGEWVWFENEPRDSCNKWSKEFGSNVEARP